MNFSSRSPGPRVSAAVAAAVAALTVWAFLPCLGNGFVAWDDDVNFLANPAFRGLAWGNVRWMLTTSLNGHYQPLAWLSAALDFLRGGLDPRAYHETNLLLHSVNAALVFLLALRACRLARGRGDKAEPRELAAAAGAALLFALHPLRVESVAWATERRQLLSTAFALGAILAYLRGRRGLSLALYVPALLADELWMPLPAILLVLDAYPLRRRPRLREKLPFAALALADGCAALWAQGRQGALTSVRSYGVGERLGQAAYGIVFYLRKSLVPLDLSPLYALTRRSFAEPAILACAAAVALASVACWRARERRPWALAAWACYLVCLVPVLGWTQAGPQLVADRYSYASCIPWALLAGAAALSRPGAAIALACSLPVLAALSRRQLAAWRDTESLWAQALRVDPDNRPARRNLAGYLAARGRPEEALKQYSAAEALCPSCADVLLEKAFVLASLARFPEALASFRRALPADPGEAQAPALFGEALLRRGRTPDAVRFLETAPRDQRREALLGAALAASGDPGRALPHLRRALSAKDDAPGRNNLGL
ncbi:MAG TPA: tetratricopeptide repeat protein, partial [Elusimicrobiota bacterium]|nr:tetratricopeptide repeat protein [Elusimicrobiota bacterium]